MQYNRSWTLYHSQNSKTTLLLFQMNIIRIFDVEYFVQPLSIRNNSVGSQTAAASAFTLPSAAVCKPTLLLVTERAFNRMFVNVADLIFSIRIPFWQFNLGGILFTFYPTLTTPSKWMKMRTFKNRSKTDVCLFFPFQFHSELIKIGQRLLLT